MAGPVTDSAQMPAVPAGADPVPADPVPADQEPADQEPADQEPLSRRTRIHEVWLLLGTSFAASALTSLIRYIGVLTQPGPVRSHVAELNGSAAPGRPWLDLSLQLAGIVTGLVPPLFALHLLARDGGGRAAIGLVRRGAGTDLLRGAGIAAVIGGSGLGLYLIAWHVGANLTVVPTTLPDVWWRIPVLIASAAQNGIAEEVVVLGYLIVRLRQLGWRDLHAVAASAVLRGGYHLYQGLGGFVGNAIMGVLFGWLFVRTRRVGPQLVAHTLIDSVAFVGYVLLVGHVAWIPRP
jgi:membrane protease YdiL (CAAX protease family)